MNINQQKKNDKINLNCSGTYSSTFSSSLWSTVKRDTAPPCESKMQRESPTEATVTVHPSMITNVTVVPEVCPSLVAKKKIKQL
jgi:hypothetical protein